MDFFLPSALGPMIARGKATHPTAIELLRIRYSQGSGMAREFHGILGDEITEYISVGDVGPRFEEGRRVLREVWEGEQKEEGGEGEREVEEVEGARVRDESSVVQILFLSSIRKKGCTSNNLKVKPSVLESLCLLLGIPFAFIESVFIPSVWSKQSGASFERYSDDGNVKSIDGFYTYFCEWDLGALHTWFSYDVASRCTTYVLIDCPITVKEKIIKVSENPDDGFLHLPCAVDILIAERCALWRERFINQHYEEIFDWHVKNGSMNPPLKEKITTLGGLQDLHQLSRTWNMICEDLTDLSERLDLLLTTTCPLLASAHIPYTSSAITTLKFLQARTGLRRRWVTSFGERTKLITGFVFGIAAQENGATNVEIAGLTTTIAEETQRDNSSMITIATMTMLFLPGTLISAIFSMVFFNVDTDSDGNEVFTVSDRLWLFFAVSGPLTIVVMAVYHLWRRSREARMISRRNVLNEDQEKGPEKTEPQIEQSDN